MANELRTLYFARSVKARRSLVRSIQEATGAHESTVRSWRYGRRNPLPLYAKAVERALKELSND